MKAIYTSVWDGGVEITIECNYNPENGFVSDIESVDVDGLDILEREYITLENGTELKVLSFDDFRELWIQQEVDVDEDDDEDELVDSINEAYDFDDMLDVIRLWSNKPVTKRIAEFLKRNNSCFIWG